MTIRAKFGDELVPAETNVIEEAYNFEIPTLGHELSIIVALTLFSKSLINFLNKK